MRVLVTGASGQLGYDVMEVLVQRGLEVVGCSRKELDITAQDLVQRKVTELSPHVIIHCAAYTNVNQAEIEPNLAYHINVTGTQNVVFAAESIGAKFCYISTDYVFDGLKATPYTETDLPNPINVYGKSKYEGELVVQEVCTRYFIVRTSWLYGVHGRNFVKTMLQLEKKGEAIRVVEDQVGSPTYSEDLARFLAELVMTDKFGTYHASNSGACSWYDFARAIFEMAGINVSVHPINSLQFPSLARRPAYSVLAHDAIIQNGFTPLPEWRDGLKRFFNKYKRIDSNDK